MGSPVLTTGKLNMMVIRLKLKHECNSPREIGWDKVAGRADSATLTFKEVRRSEPYSECRYNQRQFRVARFLLSELYTL